MVRGDLKLDYAVIKRIIIKQKGMKIDNMPTSSSGKHVRAMYTPLNPTFI